MNLKQQVLAAAVSRVLKDRLAEADAAGRAEVLRQLKAAREALGVKSVDIELPDGTVVGTASLSQPKPGVTVDEAGFLKWAIAEHPEEVVQAVRESFRRAVMARLRIVGDDTVVDKKTGYVVEWASVRHAAPEPTTFSVRFADGGRVAIEDAWRGGVLAAVIGGLLAIEEGQS